MKHVLMGLVFVFCALSSATSEAYYSAWYCPNSDATCGCGFKWDGYQCQQTGDPILNGPPDSGSQPAPQGYMATTYTAQDWSTCQQMLQYQALYSIMRGPYGYPASQSMFGGAGYLACTPLGEGLTMVSWDPGGFRPTQWEYMYTSRCRLSCVPTPPQ
jgi:hypothetical protein